ncbi:hypothetical protein [Spirillospora albida]|uniref:hypothetical protein n=1 Tax=Spirillospora albida TaxID=58123 RepID=UPI0004C1ED79|nr:hypothetical protein [Spirillospora albida]
MDSRIRNRRAAGPTGWLLTFLGARERALRTHAGRAGGPAEWLLVFMEVERTGLERTGLDNRRRPAVPAQRGAPEESPFGRLNVRSA